MKREKLLDIVLLCFKIILPILILLPLSYFSYGIIEGRLDDVAHLGEEGYFSGMGLYFFLSALLLLGINLFCTALGIVGWVISHRHKTCPQRRKNLITFRILTFSPLLSQILYGVVMAAAHTLIK